MKTRNAVLCAIAGLLLAACGGGSETSLPTLPASPTSPGPAITVKMTLSNLPETLPINMPATPVGATEYTWRVNFDLDNTQWPSTGDIRIGLTYSNKLADSLPTDAKITDFSATVYEYVSGSVSQSIASAVVQVTENTIILTVLKSAHPSLSNIDNSAAVQFNTFARINEQGYADSYPVVDFTTSYERIPLDGLFTDTASSISTNVDARFIDLQSMEILID